MTSKQLERITKSLQEALIEVENVLVAYVFGSIAEGREHVFSDVDVAVLLKESSLNEAMRIHSILTKLFGDRVDTLILNLAPPLLRYQVVKEGLRILSKDEDARVLFEARALSEGLDEGFLITKVRGAIMRRLLS